MASRKMEPRELERTVPAKPTTGSGGRDDVEVVHSRIRTSEPLALDDNDFGGDPYNSTGRYTALLRKKFRTDD